jgi:hypothetical protein
VIDNYFLDIVVMSDLNESMIWCTKTGELQSLKNLLKEE